MYDEYGSFGLYIAEQVGDDLVGSVMFFQSKWFKVSGLYKMAAAGREHAYSLQMEIRLALQCGCRHSRHQICIEALSGFCTHT